MAPNIALRPLINCRIIELEAAGQGTEGLKVHCTEMTLEHVARRRGCCLPDYVLHHQTIFGRSCATMSEPDHDDSQSLSDELDEDYHYAQMVTPPRSSRPILYVTPGHRADRTASLSTAAKHAVVSKSRTPERCFMTLENAPQSAIEVCHFIPKATKASEVS